MCVTPGTDFAQNFLRGSDGFLSLPDREVGHVRDIRVYHFPFASVSVERAS
jgi:hypothetical protein